jgi:hypothetical protein
MPMAFVRSLFVALLATFGILLAQPAFAELPPQFTTWADFAAITAQDSIPHVLGVVDSIERTEEGKYVVHAGDCFVEVNVERAPAVGPDGHVLIGPSRIARVDVGKKRCKQ